MDPLDPNYVLKQKQQTQRMSYVNNANTYTDSQGRPQNELQPLSRALTPKADNNES